MTTQNDINTINIQAGQTLSFIATMYQLGSSGPVIDLTGSTLSIIEKSASSPSPNSIVFEGSPTLGKIKVTFLPAQTLSMNRKNGHRYRIAATFSAEQRIVTADIWINVK